MTVFLIGANVVDGILLQVNDDILTMSEFRARVKQTLSPAAVQGPDGMKALEELYDQFMKEMLLGARAKERGMSADREQIHQAKLQLMKQNNIATEEDFEQAVKASGLSMEQIEAKLAVDIVLEQVLYSEVYTKRDVTDWELEQFYTSHSADFLKPKTYEVSLLLILKDKHPGSMYREAIDRVKSSLAEGGDFAALAAEMTDGPAKEAQGNLGRIQLKDMAPQMAEIIEGMKAGEVSEPIEQDFGTQWVRLNAIHEAELPPLAEVKTQLLDRYLQEKYKDKFDTFLEDLKERYYISEHKELLESVLEH